jgi:hypothetical protein
MIIEELEKSRPPALALKPYHLRSSPRERRKMVVRGETGEIGVLLETVHPLMVCKGLPYDIVAARMYAELLGWYCRVANEFVIVGAVNGEIWYRKQQARGRRHRYESPTATVERGPRIGAQLFAERWSTTSSFSGRRRWIVAGSPTGSSAGWWSTPETAGTSSPKSGTSSAVSRPTFSRGPSTTR